MKKNNVIMYNSNFYKNLKKPEITPEPKVFQTAWIILYILMFLALFFVIREPDSAEKIKGIYYFALQFLLNILWSPIFFVFEMPRAALLLSIMLVFAVGTTVYFFAQTSVIAFSLLLPYWIWICFACFLNWEIVILNPDKRL